MQQNLILAGVGGQGILTIARAISTAALRRDLTVKQAEVHGMSQRGGAVQSHLRLADHELHSDLIPLGQADIVLAVEPLETLRYVQYLRTDGVIVASTNAVVNIDNYPSIEQVLERVAAYPRHVLLDADGLARKAGSVRSANIIAFGAASPFLEIDAQELEDGVAEMFSRKGPEVVEVNRRAFRIGRNAAAAYREALSRGLSSRAAREWIDQIPIEQLAAGDVPAATVEADTGKDRLTGAEIQAFERSLVRAYEEGRRQLYEHEVYKLVEIVGAISPPRYVFVPRDGMISAEALQAFPGDRVVLKVVSPQIVHKTEAKGIVFAPKDHNVVKREIDRLVAAHRETAHVEGVLVVEFVERAEAGFGNELFVGVRATREFGPVIAAGLGGVDTEYLATKMKPGIAVAKACAMDTTAEHFFALFQRTAAYDLLSGRTRGHSRIVSDGELLRCFRAFISIARQFCVDRGAEGPDVAELEVNPFAFRHQRMIPLDGRGRLETAAKGRPPRPIDKVQRMLEPRAVAVLGVSKKSKTNFGRIILNNIQACGCPPEHLYVVKEDETEIDGAPCVPNVAALPEVVDLLVIAVPAATMPGVVDEVVKSKKVGAAIMIPGGVGETEGSEEIQRATQAAIDRGRELPDGGPVFLGPNCMGIQSRPGHYDTFFIPTDKLDSRWTAPARRVGLVSQSGAFIIARLSNLETLDPAVSISLGNQIDLTLADLLAAVGTRDDIDAIGVYAEGFANMGGLDFVRAVADITAAGKIVVFYKAGRTSSGRSAAAGHTASVAGDYDVCQAAVENAGAIVCETFKEFEQMLELATALHGKKVAGRRIGAVSNAGYETVGMADNVTGGRHQVDLAPLSDETRERLVQSLTKYKLDKLVNARNPLDMTPMATDEAYAQCAQVVLDSPDVDAVVASFVPLTPAMLTTPDEVTKSGSVAERLAKLFDAAGKPLVVSIDSGPRYDALARVIRAAGVPVFRSADQAMQVLGRYLCHRSAIVESREAPANNAAPPGAPATGDRRARPRPVKA